MFLLNLFLLVSFYEYGLTEDIKDFNVFQLFQLAQDVTKFAPEVVENNDVTFYITTRSSQTPTKLDNSNQNLVDLSKPTKFIIHGWLESYKISWYQEIANEFFIILDCNFIEVDWKRPARFNYISSASNTKEIGYKVAKFIIDTKINPETTHLIGHSLGSHVAGFAGKKVYETTGKKIKRISALDPAGPFFRQYLAYSSKRLSKHDAVIVDAIHTDAGFNGYELPIGTVDFYINGGKRVQPGCFEPESASLGGLVQSSFCSHSRSHVYFAEWINKGKFQCRFCTFATQWLGENCILQENPVLLGEEDVTEHTNGICYAVTNLEPPFLQNVYE